MNYQFENNDLLLDKEIVLLDDERKQVKHTTHPPFRWICSLEVEFPEPILYPLGTLEHPGKAWKDLKPTIKGCGSGILISPKHILTASHVIAGLKVVKNSKTGKPVFRIVPAKKVIAIPGRNEENKSHPRPFGVFTSQKIFISPGFQSALELPISQLSKTQVRRALASDFGIIEIRETPNRQFVIPGQLTGWWREFSNFQILPVNKNLKAQLQKGKVHIVGFPGEKGNIPCSTMWKSFDKVIRIFPRFHDKSENLILYQADTSAGMSGSPVWIKDKNGKHYLVAIHSSFLDFFDKKERKKIKANVGALVTKEMIRHLRLWKVEYLELLFSNYTGFVNW